MEKYESLSNLCNKGDDVSTFRLQQLTKNHEANTFCAKYLGKTDIYTPHFVPNEVFFS